MLGHVTLNISLILYLVYYIPQLLHNAKGVHLRHLSLQFHSLLLIAYLGDLVYGFGLHMPWQYKLVSVVGLLCLLYQHKQLFVVHRALPAFKRVTYGVGMSVCVGVLLIVFKAPLWVYLSLGMVVQMSSIIHKMPQIIRNRNGVSAKSMSQLYLWFGFAYTLCDNVSAWSLGWPWPNKGGAALRLVLCVILLWQNSKVRVVEYTPSQV